MNTIETRTKLLNKLIHDNRLTEYLEIGVSNPDINYNNICCEHKAGVDPCIKCENYSDEQSSNFGNQISFKGTSDEFFDQLDKSDSDKLYDIIFIDGLHTADQLIKDIYNSFKHLSFSGYIVCHDSLPDDIKYATDIRENNDPWTGTCWKALTELCKISEISMDTIYFDWGMCVLRFQPDSRTEADRRDILSLIGLVRDDINFSKFTYENDYNPRLLNPGYSYSQLDTCEKYHVSYFTSCYNTNILYFKNTLKSVLNQTDPNWEWIIFDDSNDNMISCAIQDMINDANDARIKLFRMHPLSGGMIGLAKKRATLFCRGTFIAELDHDDMLMPDLTERLYSEGIYHKADFIYTDSIDVYYNISNDDMKSIEKYSEGFGMGYGSYYDYNIKHPLTGKYYNLTIQKCSPINPKTIRHIVGVPNHVRCWRKEFYDKIGGYDENLPHADDYELIVRSFCNNGVFLHLNYPGYIQTYNNNTATNQRRISIQEYVKAIVAHYDRDIAEVFNNCDKYISTDWAYNYMLNTESTSKCFQYWKVPNFPDIYDKELCEKMGIYSEEEYNSNKNICYEMNLYDRPDSIKIINAGLYGKPKDDFDIGDLTIGIDKNNGNIIK